MYDNSKSRVASNGMSSEYFPSKTGVRQGESLSILLFALYLNDLENYLIYFFADLTSLSRLLENDLNMHLKLFVDDIVLILESKAD